MDAKPVVFIVDDDPSVLKALTRLLSGEGFHTRPFANPAQFLRDHDFEGAWLHLFWTLRCPASMASSCKSIWAASRNVSQSSSCRVKAISPSAFRP